MTTYMVFEENKPARIDSSPLNRNGIWSSAEFSSKRDAEIYAYLWCHKVTKEEAFRIAPEMELGVKYDYSSGGLSFGEPIIMSILEVVEE